MIANPKTHHVVLCAGCMKREFGEDLDRDVFIAQVRQQLDQQLPDQKWEVKTNACLRLCPDHKIAFTLNRRLTMARQCLPESILKEINSLMSEKS